MSGLRSRTGLGKSGRHLTLLIDGVSAVTVGSEPASVKRLIATMPIQIRAVTAKLARKYIE